MVAKFINDLRQKFTLLLLYRGTRDGWTGEQIHCKIDYKGPTITIIKTNTGKIFGGYTFVSWDRSASYKTDNEAFIFSVDLS